MAGPGRAAQTSTDATPGAAFFGVLIALLLGAAVRIPPLAVTNFPLNDGGLFAQMTADLVANGFLLPASTSYNGLDIPFAYPPLAFYTAGLILQVAPVSVADVFRIMPLVLSLATIPVLYSLASAVLASRAAGVVAAVAFALLPRSYVMMITGGGITRVLGFFLAIVALTIAWYLLRQRTPAWRLTAILGLLGGLTALAHPQAAVFMAVSIAVFLPWAADRRGLFHVLTAGGIGLLVALPWLIAVVGLHGIDPLLSGLASGGDVVRGVYTLVTFRFTEFQFLDLIAIVALVGAGLAAHRGQWMLPLWLVAVLVVDSRAGGTYSMVPMALLAAYLIRETWTWWVPAGPSRPVRWLAHHPWRTAGLVTLLLFLVLGNYLSSLFPSSPLFALSPENREAMETAAEDIPMDANVAVVVGQGIWETDSTSEWFPVISGRRSVGTVQGYEWLGPEQWDAQRTAYSELQECGMDVLSCVTAWAADHEVNVDYVYIPKGSLRGPFGNPDCCPAPRHSVELVPGARVIYDGAGATVIELP
jgi:hypothetical protein